MDTENSTVVSDTSTDPISCLTDFEDYHPGEDRKRRKLHKVKKTKNRLKKLIKKVPEIIQKSESRQIPESKLKKAIEILETDINELIYSKNKYKRKCQQNLCKNLINGTNNMITNLHPYSHLRLIHESNSCLVKQDWKNLAKVLHTLISQKYDRVYFSVTLRYCVISILNDPIVKQYKPELIDRFLEGVIQCTSTDDMDEFIKSILQFSTMHSNLQIN